VPICLIESRAGFGDCFGDGRVHFSLACAGGQIRFDDGELFRFLGDEFGSVAFGKMVDRLFALFLRAFAKSEWLRLRRVGESFSTSLCLIAALIPRRTLRRSFLFGAHGVDQILLNFFRKTHLRFLTSLNIADREIRREGMVRGGPARHEPYLFDSARAARYF